MSRLVQDTIKFGGGLLMVLRCMSQVGVRNCCRMDGRMDGDLYAAILDEDVVDSISHFSKTPLTPSSSRTVTPSTPAKRPRTGSKTTAFESYHGQHSLQTSIQLSSSGSTSRGGFGETPHHLKRYQNCRGGWKRSGRPLPIPFAVIWWRTCTGKLHQ